MVRPCRTKITVATPQTLLGLPSCTVIVDSALYRKGQRVEVDCFPHEFEKLRAEATDAGDFVWVGLYKPSEGELDDVAESFGLHPLAVEDALKAHQRPKLERYDGQPVPDPQDALVRRRRGRRRDRRDQPLRGHRLRDHGPPRPGLRAALGALPARVRHRDPAPTAPARSSTRSATPWSTATARCSTSSRSTSTRSRPRSSPPRAPTTPTASTCSSARSRRCAAPCSPCASRCASSPTGMVDRVDPRGGAVLPRRPRPPQPGRRGRRQPRLAALDRLRRPPGADLGPAERRHAQDLGRRRPWWRCRP